MQWLVFLIVVGSGLRLNAYPHFIGYKYTSCMTCHYNGHGNGAINDYGRALWATEIASRALTPNTSVEVLGERSGFLGRTQLPWWIRPGVKARNLWLTTNPGSKQAVRRSILMQAEMNLALFFDQEMKRIFVATYGYQPAPAGSRTEKAKWFMREYFLRWQLNEAWFLSTGLMDKVFGLRHANHTATNRGFIGLGQSDQTHGVVLHRILPEQELAAHIFIGNQTKEKAQQKSGLSLLYEKDILPEWRWGTSLMTASSEQAKENMLSVHTKRGFGNGNALLFELGLRDELLTQSEKTLGYFLFTEAIQTLHRGYQVFATAQGYKRNMSASETDLLKLGVGLLAFPIQRLEWRVELENILLLNNEAAVEPDTWLLLNQLHFSF